MEGEGRLGQEQFDEIKASPPYWGVCAIWRCSQVGRSDGVRPSVLCKLAIRVVTSPSLTPR